MANSVDAISGDAMQTMLASYRNTGDTTGAVKKSEAANTERTETNDERTVRKGKNDTAVYLDISAEAWKKYRAESPDGQPQDNAAEKVDQANIKKSA
ncbi:MAG: hypothetical protein HW380_1351 [Magnetococcales bacterium]|nr:hypothetical protein [Magnetococcales bacterium]